MKQQKAQDQEKDEGNEVSKNSVAAKKYKFSLHNMVVAIIAIK